MVLKIDISPLAEEDIDQAVYWYNGQRENLGEEFFLELMETLRIVSLHPFAFRVRHKQARAFSLKRFPYKVYYLVSRHSLYVLAVIHQKRSSKIWKARISGRD